MRTIIRNISIIALLIVACGGVRPARAADSVRVSAELGNSAILLGKGPTTAYLKIGIAGVREDKAPRPPLNIAVVIDRSGSMQGDKIIQAREGACRAVDLLDDNDIISVIAFGSEVEVLVPATKARNRESIKAAINRLEATTNTALFAGVSKGAAEVRKFLEKKMINRVVLLSDGQANEGPSSVNELGELGASLAREGMAVSTVGLGYGYNEDLMAELAARSDGSFIFAEKASQLTDIFQKGFRGAMDVVAKRADIRLRCAEGVRPIRTLNREASITGTSADSIIREIYGNQEKYVIVELEIQPGKDGEKRRIADLEVVCDLMATGKSVTVTQTLDATYVAKVDEAQKTENAPVMVEVVTQIANDRNKLAMRLRDEGKREEARKMLVDNAGYLSTNAGVYKSESLKVQSVLNTKQSKDVDASQVEYEQSRKGMRAAQNAADLQQDLAKPAF